MSTLYGPTVTWVNSDPEFRVCDPPRPELGGIIPNDGYVAGVGNTDPVQSFSSGVDSAIAIFHQFVAFVGLNHRDRGAYQEMLVDEFTDEMATLMAIYIADIPEDRKDEFTVRNAFDLLFSAYKEARLIRHDAPSFALCFLRILRGSDSLRPTLEAFRSRNKLLPSGRVRFGSKERDVTFLDGMCFYKSVNYDTWLPVKWLFTKGPKRYSLHSWTYIKTPTGDNLLRYFDNPKEAFVACALTAFCKPKASSSLIEMLDTPLGKEITHAGVRILKFYLSDRVEWIFDTNVTELGEASEDDIEKWMARKGR